MKKNLEIYKSWFTLVEVIVAVTIFSMIMISVLMIFANTNDLSMKIDVDRILQENTKNIIETISDDLKNQDIKTCWDGITDWCIWQDKLTTSNELWVWNNHYYLAKESSILWTYIKISSLDDCKTNQCFIMKNWEILSNSYVTIKKLEFNIFSDHNSKVQINMIIYPMSWKWIKSYLITQNKLNVQTTLNDNYLK